jgi:hypothetical protein
VIRFVVVTGLVGAGARAAEAPPVTVAPGFVTTLKYARPANIVAVGNPAVADVSLGPERTLVITGKAPGSTNVVLLDDAGNAVLSVQIIVGTGREVSVRIYDGSDKSTTERYLCSRTTCVPSQVVTERPERQPGKAAPPAEP